MTTQKLASSPAQAAAASVATSERSYPLVALMQLATFWAALAACVDGSQLRNVMDHPPEERIFLAILTGLGLVMGGGIGLFLGLGQMRRWRSAAVGFVAGALSSAAILAVYLAPAPVERGVAAAMLLVFTTTALRWRTP